METKNKTLQSVLEALKKEVEKEEIAPDKVAALSEAIKVLDNVNPL